MLSYALVPLCSGFILLPELTNNVKYDDHILRGCHASSNQFDRGCQKFSELLNTIKYRGDRYTVIRGGKPAACLIPVNVSDHDAVY